MSQPASKVCELGARTVHLHWIGDGFLLIKAFSRFKSPVVWSFHDPWPFTGGCHYPGSCLRYQESCGACPQLGSARSKDLSRWVRSQKRRHFRSADLTAVAQSRWLWQCARSSSLFRDRRIGLIPYGLDETLYKPLDRVLARRALNLPEEEKIIVMGAMNSTTDKRKGMDHLVTAARAPAGRGWGTKTRLVVFGATDTPAVTDFGLDTRLMGMIHDDYSLALICSAADVFVAPSTEEAFGLTVLEAMACGTPCVGFDVGGIPDMIEDRQTGFLVRSVNGEALAEGIAWILQDEDRRKTLCRNAGGLVESKFTSRLYAQRYLNLYEEILKREGGGEEAKCCGS